MKSSTIFYIILPITLSAMFFFLGKPFSQLRFDESAVKEIEKQYNITEKCSQEISVLRKDTTELYIHLNKPFDFLRFLPFLEKNIEELKHIKQACDGQQVVAFKSIILTLVPKIYRQCVTSVLDGAKDLSQLVLVILNHQQWYPIAEEVLYVVNDIIKSVHFCMNPKISQSLEE